MKNIINEENIKEIRKLREIDELRKIKYLVSDLISREFHENESYPLYLRETIWLLKLQLERYEVKSEK